ncbi:50S ribosomal protein L11 methyltransferase [Pedobacter sp. SYSU D00535]|uniref:50S ribosomal protein L11 methyltransferase n=1 Tax=Pedobacter sp. SYSU D00535 TaxID=2810308 RepID=UPI001A95CE80|nr:50S ribosomal protein L11 methyltransferase [Pedobacter sp. SYSU D00535]
MGYYEFIFTLQSEEDFHRDLLINALAEAGFDTFEETSAGFNAYISSSELDQEKLNEALLGYEEMFSFSYEKNLIPQKNWNEEWESNFEPLTIKDECYVRATFHAPRPEFRYEIVIDPKMSFGTGHHQTTTMMMEYILEEDFQGKTVLDMGCGTGILAILARKTGAVAATAIDYDPICYDSAIENTHLNNTPEITVLCGSKEAIPNQSFDIILANINRNILLDQLSSYAVVLKNGGSLFISGFYQEDIAILEEEAQLHSLKKISSKQLDNWASVKFIKENLK